MNIAKTKRNEIVRLRKTGMAIEKIANLVFPAAMAKGESVKPVLKACKHIKYKKRPAWMQFFR